MPKLTTTVATIMKMKSRLPCDIFNTLRTRTPTTCPTLCHPSALVLLHDAEVDDDGRDNDEDEEQAAGGGDQGRHRLNERRRHDDSRARQLGRRAYRHAGRGEGHAVNNEGQHWQRATVGDSE